MEVEESSKTAGPPSIAPPGNDTPGEVARYIRRMLEESDLLVLYHHPWCKKCGLCVDICPRKALARDRKDYPVLAFPERCISCGMCEFTCPDFAVTALGAKRKAQAKKDKEG